MQIAIPGSLQEFEALSGEMRVPEKLCELFLSVPSLFDGDKDAGAAAMNLLF